MPPREVHFRVRSCGAPEHRYYTSSVDDDRASVTLRKLLGERHGEYLGVPTLGPLLSACSRRRPLTSARAWRTPVLVATSRKIRGEELAQVLRHAQPIRAPIEWQRDEDPAVALLRGSDDQQIL